MWQRPSFDRHGISVIRREGIETAVEAGGQRLARPYEAWIAARRPGSHHRAAGLRKTVAFALDEAPKRILSPAARRRMAAAQRKRWAAARKANAAATTPAPAKAAKKKRRLSPDGRARIIAATAGRRDD